MYMVALKAARIGMIACSLISVACSKPNTDVQYGEPISVRLSVGSGRPEMEMALAVAGGHSQPPPNVIADALVRIAKACPEVDSLAKSEEVIRLRLKVRDAVLHSTESSSSPRAPEGSPIACAAKAIDGSPFPGKSDSEFDALAEIRAAASKEATAKGATQ